MTLLHHFETCRKKVFFKQEGVRMSDKLPKQMGPFARDVMLTAKKLVSFPSYELYRNISYAASNGKKSTILSKAKTDGWISRNDKTGLYKLTDLGKRICTALEKGQIKHRRAQGEHTAVLKKIPPPPQAPKMNISNQAELMMDNVTGLISQNSNYRELMLGVINRIAGELNLEVKEKEDVVSS